MKDILNDSRALIVNMFQFSISAEVTIEVLVNLYQELYYGDKDLPAVLAVTNQVSSPGKVLGGIFYPTTVNMEGPFSLSGSLNALDSAQSFFSDAVYRPGNLVEFAQYVCQGGQVGNNVLIVGDEECSEYFQIINRDSEYHLLLISKTNETTKEKLAGCCGIFTVAIPTSRN